VSPTDTQAGILQAAAVVGTLALLHVPLGDYIFRHLVTTPSAEGDAARAAAEQRPGPGKPHWRAERWIYRAVGVDADREQNWVQYLRSVLALCATGILVLYAILRLQAHLPYSEGDPGLNPALAWDTAVSFVTNTSWQNYAGESTTGYTAVVAGLGLEAFASAAVGLAVALALVRGLIRRETRQLGNFWVDFTRSCTRVLLPLSLVAGVILVGAGVIDNWHARLPATLADGTGTLIPGGPVAAWEPIKLISGDGGGFFNASSAHPFENPNGFSSAIEIVLMLIVPTALLRTYGRMVGSVRAGYTLLAVAGTLFLLLAALTMLAQHRTADTTTAAAGGAMNGVETRLGVNGSSLFGISSTSSADGAGAASYDSFTALGGGLLMSAMMLGEISPGGVGSGLYGLLMVALVAVFLGGLMVGRTPEFAAKRISSSEMRYVALYLLSGPLMLLTGTALAIALPGERASMNNVGAHGFSEVLYAFTSSANSNGSSFAGLNGNTTWYNLALAFVMLFGRYLPMVFVLALAGSLARQRAGVVTSGTVRTTGPLFAGLTVFSALVLVGLTFLPALALGPIADGLH
jgi:K+-transporting ATPase KdpA subunit